jgi:hypothetical protein
VPALIEFPGDALERGAQQPIGRGAGRGERERSPSAPSRSVSEGWGSSSVVLLASA